MKRTEIRIRLNVENKCYFIIKEIFFSKLLHRRTKERLDCAYLSHIVRYAYEMLSSTQGKEKRLQSFERKIYEPQWRAVVLEVG